MAKASFDVVIVGGGFYGCALALYLGRSGNRVLVIEAGRELMTRASAVNQARVHTGFHYPRSFVTALRSLHNYPRFVEEFRRAIVDDFQMLYAIARERSKVNARRFLSMYQAMGAPIRPARPADRSLFDDELIEDVFLCEEHAFDHTILRDLLLERLEDHPVEVLKETEVRRVARGEGGLAVHLADGSMVHAPLVFNITYAQLNSILRASAVRPIEVKHELTELALVAPPAELSGKAVTVMDGAYFSAVPYPSRRLYSLTHVRYTPHYGWTDESAGVDAYRMKDRLPQQSRWRHMAGDAARYMPCFREVDWRESHFEVKTVPIRNEANDGRPILFHTHPELPGFHSVLGSKIDNIYDLFEAVDHLDHPLPSPALGWKGQQ